MPYTGCATYMVTPCRTSLKRTLTLFACMAAYSGSQHRHKLNYNGASALIELLKELCCFSGAGVLASGFVSFKVLFQRNDAFLVHAARILIGNSRQTVALAGTHADYELVQCSRTHFNSPLYSASYRSNASTKLSEKPRRPAILKCLIF